LENIYKQDKNTAIIILWEQWKWLNSNNDILIKKLTNIWKGLNQFIDNNNLEIQPISYLENKWKTYFSLTI
jgi:hypothetical protein